ncbi:hypothetical protein SNEBB_011372 [Seison nebaliae]|nr:hypothetical protein SNEBB_011372 [Seison nebaliae]
MEDFGENSTCHGIYYLFSSKSKRLKFIWGAILFAAVGMLINSMFMNVSTFVQFQTFFVTENSEEFFQELPAITICNSNQFDKLYNQQKIDGGLQLDLINLIGRMRRNDIMIKQNFGSILYPYIIKTFHNYKIKDKCLDILATNQKSWQRLIRLFGFINSVIFEYLECAGCYKKFASEFAAYQYFLYYFQIIDIPSNQINNTKFKHIELDRKNEFIEAEMKRFDYQTRKMVKDFETVRIDSQYKEDTYKNWRAKWMEVLSIDNCNLNLLANDDPLYKIHPNNSFQHNITNFRKRYKNSTINIVLIYKILKSIPCTIFKIFQRVEPYTLNGKFVNLANDIIDYIVNFNVKHSAFEECFFSMITRTIKEYIDSFNNYFPNRQIPIDNNAPDAIDHKNFSFSPVASLNGYGNYYWKALVLDGRLNYIGNEILEFNKFEFNMRDIIKTFSWTINDHIIFCLFNKIPCPKKLFYHVFKPDGVCFRQNNSLFDQLTKSKSFQILPGKELGLQLVFYSNSPYDISTNIFSNEPLNQGVRMFVNSHSREPSSVFGGVILSKNHIHNIVIERRQKKLLSSDEIGGNDCKKSMKEYTSCYDNCWHNVIKSFCHCIYFSDEKYNLTDNWLVRPLKKSNFKYCTKFINTLCNYVYLMAKPIKTGSSNSTMCAQCIRPSCTKDTFEKQMTISVFTEDELKNYKNEVISNCKLEHSESECGKICSKQFNFYGMNIYFNKMDYEIKSEKLLVNVLKLFSRIGGATGGNINHHYDELRKKRRSA